MVKGGRSLNKKCVAHLKATPYSREDNIQNRAPYSTRENIMKRAFRNLEKIKNRKNK